ncbi:MAG: PEP-CTERM sorting domain-containing protein [Paludibaculum sp.]
MTIRQLLIGTMLTVAHAGAAVILNTPGSANFYNNYTDGVIPGTVSSASLPAFDGVEGVKLWGSATMDNYGDFAPSFYLSASGTASGSLDMASIFQVNWSFILSREAFWDVQASVTTSDGYYYSEFFGISSGQVTGSQALEKVSIVIPAGTTVTGWTLFISAGEFGAPSASPLTLTIPQNSIDLFAFDASRTGPLPTPGSTLPIPPASVPEPGTWLLSGFALTCAGIRRYRRP